MSNQLTIAGWFITPVLDAVTDKALSSALKKIWLQYSVNDDDLVHLQDCLYKARVLLNYTETKQLQLVFDNNLLLLQTMTRSAILEAESFLERLEHEHQAAETQESASYFLSTVSALKKCFYGLNVTAEIRRIQMKLQIFTPDHQVFRLHVGNQYEIRETSSFLTTPVFGREEQRDRVVQHLVNPDNKNSPLSVAAIVGPPGIGKTALAQFIVNDSRVKKHFEVCMWVPAAAAAAFDVLKITQQIVDSMPEETCLHQANLNQLHMILEKLQTRRFLLVFDNIWNENESKWETLIAPLTMGSQGSMILGTTRSQMVAETMGAAYSIYLNGLPNESYFPFFKRCAFGSQNSEDYPMLEKIGENIARKLMGSPLAARTVGNYLKTQLEENHWIDTFESELCDLPQGENGILAVAASSYWNLPPHLRPCVSFCSLFPKYARLDKENLVQVWKAHDFIMPEGSKRKEDVGNRYFHELIRRSFFQKHNDYYIMDPLLHDVVRAVSKDEFATINGHSQAIPSTVHHISFQAPKVELSQFIRLCKDKELRSLLFFGNYDPELGSALGELKYKGGTIRVLDLGHCNITHLPENISYLNQLRYFDAHGTRIDTLPISFCGLKKLQVLKVPSNPAVHLPEEVSKLKSRGCKIQAI